MKTVLVEVTQRDINMGARCHPTTCPIALAARRAGLTHCAVYGVGGWYPYGVNSIRGTNMPMTASAERFIEAFDQHRPVKPSRFRLQVSE